MKIAIIEPLGIDEKAVEKLKQDFLPENIELVYYNSAPLYKLSQTFITKRFFIINYITTNNSHHR